MPNNEQYAGAWTSHEHLCPPSLTQYLLVQGSLNATPGIHFCPRRGGAWMADYGGGTAAQDAASGVCRYSASRVPGLCRLPDADGRTWLSRGPELRVRISPSTECR